MTAVCNKTAGATMSTNRQEFLDNFTTGRTLLGSVLWRYTYDLFALLNPAPASKHAGQVQLELND